MFKRGGGTMSLYRDLEKITEELRIEGFEDIADEIKDIAWDVKELENNSDNIERLESDITKLENELWEIEDKMIIKPTTLYEQDKAEIVAELYDNYTLVELQNILENARNNKS